MSTRAITSLAGVRSRSDRILIVTFQGNAATSVVVTYAPTNASKKETVKGYNADIRRYVESVSVHNIFVMLGDFNKKNYNQAMPHTHTTNNKGIKNRYCIQYAQ